MKKIAVGDLGEFWYGDYKEPFVQLEGAVPGYPQGVVLKADDGKLLCPWCGKTYHGLGQHITLRHGVSGPAAKEQMGLLQKSALASEQTRWRYSARALRRVAAGYQLPRPARGSGRRPSQRDGRTSAEKNNMTGRCHAQIVAVARTYGDQLTRAKLARHGITREVIERRFGSMEALRRLVGSKPPRQLVRFTDSEILDALRRLAADLGRTPTRSDIRCSGLLSPTTFTNRFGSYRAACRAAGLSPHEFVAVTDDLEAQVLATYAIYASTEATAQALHLGLRRIQDILHRYGFPFGRGHQDAAARREWATDMARRLAGWPEEAPAA